jgi:hypothetical protein
MTHCYYSVNVLLHLSFSYLDKPSLLLGAERMGKVGHILPFYNDGEFEDVTQGSPRVVTKENEKGPSIFKHFSFTTQMAF